MTCNTCHQEIPQNKKSHAPLLACPRCLAAKSYQAILNFQRQFLPRILKGDLPVTITRPADEYKWHMVFAVYAQAWCGRPIEDWKNKKRAPYFEIADPVCERCREVFEGLVEDQTPEVA